MNANKTPVILIHNQLHDRYEIVSADFSVFRGISEFEPDSVTRLTSLAEEFDNAEVVPINGRLGKRILTEIMVRRGLGKEDLSDEGPNAR